ncbi:hypothetical protein AVEN_244633-1 [Araneus ventricosus]|uniref:Uncharacterized protein n=1 Tax=Araneus ventricosus TaxID=182803 RepID=A0A4Y2L5R3_ARAVE|nr:hypothetical protein AVEN_244633-1 [Araneus ventricosus]
MESGDTEEVVEVQEEIGVEASLLITVQFKRWIQWSYGNLGEMDQVGYGSLEEMDQYLQKSWREVEEVVKLIRRGFRALEAADMVVFWKFGWRRRR